MSSAIRLPSAVDRSDACCSSSCARQPPRRKTTYVSICSSLFGGDDGRTNVGPGNRRNYRDLRGRLPVFEQLEPASAGDGLSSTARVQFAQQPGDVVVDRAARDKEPLCDLGVAE